MPSSFSGSGPVPDWIAATPIWLSLPQLGFSASAAPVLPSAAEYSFAWQYGTPASFAVAPGGSVRLKPLISCWPSPRLIVSW